MGICTKCGRKMIDNDLIYWKCTQCGKVFNANFGKLKNLWKQKQTHPGQALLKCPGCGYGIDDGNEILAYKCPDCGVADRGNLEKFVNSDNDIEINPDNIMVNNLIKCPDCGKQISLNADTCPNCGHPFRKKNNRILIVILTTTISLIIIGLIIGKVIHDKQIQKQQIIIQKETEEKIQAEKEEKRKIEQELKIAQKEYEELIITTVKLIKVNQLACEITGAGIYSTWDQIIDRVEEDKVNILTHYITGGGNLPDIAKSHNPTIYKEVDAIVNLGIEITNKMAELKNYPDGYENDYNLMLELYAIYQSFETLCTKFPNNYSLLEYSTTFTNNDNELSELINKLRARYPEIKE